VHQRRGKSKDLISMWTFTKQRLERQKANSGWVISCFLK
jgi:hypothetical protein